MNLFKLFLESTLLHTLSMGKNYCAHCTFMSTCTYIYIAQRCTKYFFRVTFSLIVEQFFDIIAYVNTLVYISMYIDEYVINTYVCIGFV